MSRHYYANSIMYSSIRMNKYEKYNLMKLKMKILYSELIMTLLVAIEIDYMIKFCIE